MEPPTLPLQNVSPDLDSEDTYIETYREKTQRETPMILPVYKTVSRIVRELKQRQCLCLSTGRQRRSS